MCTQVGCRESVRESCNKEDNAITDEGALYISLRVRYVFRLDHQQSARMCWIILPTHEWMWLWWWWERVRIRQTTEASNYLVQFKTGTTTMEEGPAVLLCKGPCLDSSHTLTTAVDHCKCKKCNVVACELFSTALKLENTDKELYCLDWYFIDNLLLDEGTGLNNDKTTYRCFEMRKRKQHECYLRLCLLHS